MIKLLLAIQLIVPNIRNLAILKLKTIVENWRLFIAEYIKFQMKSNIYLQQIALILFLYKNNYKNT